MEPPFNKNRFAVKFLWECEFNDRTIHIHLFACIYNILKLYSAAQPNTFNSRSANAENMIRKPEAGVQKKHYKQTVAAVIKSATAITNINEAYTKNRNTIFALFF